MSVIPSLNTPEAMASVMILSAARSFTDPDGLWLSSFAYNLDPRANFSSIPRSLTVGVPPISEIILFSILSPLTKTLSMIYNIFNKDKTRTEI